MNVITAKFVLSMVLAVNGQYVDKTIPFESGAACQNGKEEMKAAYTTYGMTEETITVVSQVCVDSETGTVQ